MMDGIHILNIIEEPIYGFGWNSGFGWFFMILGIVIAIASISLTIIEKDEINLLFLLLTFLTVPLSMSGFFYSKVIDTYNIYEVTIDNSVSFTEFTQKYDIIEQRNEIYVIKEKDAL